MVLFATGAHDLPLWLNLLAMLAPVGFGLGAARGLLRGRRGVAGRRAARRNAAGDSGRSPSPTRDRMTGDDGAGVVQVAQHVDDLDRATAFYTETLGLPLIARFGPLVFVDLGGTRLLLEEEAPPAMIYLGSTDLRPRSTSCAPRASRSWPSRTTSSPTPTACSAAHWQVESQAFIRDSEGNLVGLVGHR